VRIRELSLKTELSGDARLRRPHATLRATLHAEQVLSEEQMTGAAPELVC